MTQAAYSFDALMDITALPAQAAHAPSSNHKTQKTAETRNTISFSPFCFQPISFRSFPTTES